MKAITKYKYGGPEVLSLEEVEKPKIEKNHLLIKVKANSVNPADWRGLRGKPFLARFNFGLFKPKDKVFGADFAGIVIETGEAVSKFTVGDRVFGTILEGGTFAEFASVHENVCGLIPEQATYEEMACVPIAGLTALQALIRYGKLKKGESVLINGSSGGVGHFAVQIAKAHGASVTAVCSSKNKEFVKFIGADKVIEYNKENIHQHRGAYDLIVDIHGNLNHSDYKRMGKRGIMVGFTTMQNMTSVLLKNIFSEFSLTQFTVKANNEDLNALAQLLVEGKLNAHIEKTYSYFQVPKAVACLELMRTRGKLGISWEL